MAQLRLAVCSGTTVPPDLVIKVFGLELLHLSPAELFYREVLKLRPESQAIALRRAGLGNLDTTYLSFERGMLEYADGEAIDAVFHSQPCLHGMYFIIRNPGVVRRALFVNGPFHGAAIARYLSAVPCAADMSPHSPYLKGLHRDAEEWRVATEAELLRDPDHWHPDLHFIGLKHDGIVQYHSPYLDLGRLAHFHCIGDGDSPNLLYGHTQWHGLQVDPSHFTVISDKESVGVLGRILEGELHGRATAKPRRRLRVAA